MKILLVQTAFIGDVVLATPLIEKLRRFLPESRIHFLLRKGNEEVLNLHPKIDKVWIWDKEQHKYKNLFLLIKAIRGEHFDLVINLQRYWSTGILSVCSGAARLIGFRSNPLSVFFDKTIPYRIADGQHEVERNLALIAALTDDSSERPRLYPVVTERVRVYEGKRIITISPGSVWATKRLPVDKWQHLIRQANWEGVILILGSRSDRALGEQLASGNSSVTNLCGELTMQESVALMQLAEMNYVNDSAPLHFASGVNAPVTAVFCSTIPELGFRPLSDRGYVVEARGELPCRPCGVHGKSSCPRRHFACGKRILVEDLLKFLPK